MTDRERTIWDRLASRDAAWALYHARIGEERLARLYIRDCEHALAMARKCREAAAS